MYYPYLRGKTFELLALLELSESLRSGSTILPIIEPVKASQRSQRQLNRLAASYNDLLLVHNPKHGDYTTNYGLLRSHLSSIGHQRGLQPTWILDATTPTRDVSRFLSAYSDHRVHFIHWGSAPNANQIATLQRQHGGVGVQVFYEGRSSAQHQEIFSEGRPILLRDCFHRRPRNVDYPQREFFSDLHRHYESLGYSGFGDFSIVGDHYFETGGAAHAVALHYINLEGDGVWVYHFLSDRTQGQVDTAGKFLEALEKLSRFVRSPANSHLTTGASDYLELYDRRHFPQLGFAKKLSIKHHLELMHSLLSVGSS